MGLFKKIILVGLAAIASLIALLVTAVFVYPYVDAPAVVNEQTIPSNQLFIPPILEPTLENGEKVFDLNIQKGKTIFFQGKETETFGFNGNYLGPTIRAQTQDKVRIRVMNQLGEATTVHWHGMHLPAVMDGGPHQAIQPNEMWQPNWTITNEAATLWYHPHLMGKTGEHIYRGLAGLFIIDDENSQSLNLPSRYGIDDIPLILQDREFDENGQWVYEHGRADLLGHTGMLGDALLVNGVHAPYVDVPATLVRLRILSGSNARRFNIGFKDNRVFYQIATDGGLLESPVPRTRMVLAPGERAEIIVDLTKETQPLRLISDAIIEENRAFRFVKGTTDSRRDENQIFMVLEIRPKAVAGEVSAPLPKTLNSIEWLDEQDAVKTRRFLVGGDSINGKPMDPLRIDEVVHAGDVEIWDVRQVDGSTHPFHVHGVQFQILERNGKTPPDYERGWKDTVNLNNGENARIIMRLPMYADPNVPYMFHCHILEHEDMGMMGQFVVVNKDTREEDVSVKKGVVAHDVHGH